MWPKFIRMLYLQPAAHFGGAERQASTVIPMLRDHGIEAIPYVGPGRAICEWLEERGVDDYVHSRTFPGGWPKHHGLTKAALPLRYGRCLRDFRREIARVIEDRAIDVIFAAMPFSWIAATDVARRLGTPIVWRAGGTECSPALRRLLAIWARFNRPDVLVCNGESVRRLYAPLIGAPSVMIRNGIDHRQFHPGAGARHVLRPAGSRLVVGFAGRLVPQKRPQDFIRAAARFAARDEVTFLLAGEGSRRASYERLADELGARTLRVLGYVGDMRDFYAACDLLVLPSRSEGCPNVVLEAMAMKTGVIAADAPATREIVTTGVDGLLYSIGDVDALARAISQLIDQPETRRVLVERAYRRVTQRLTAEACATSTARLLRSVADGHGARRLPASTQARSRQS